MTQHKTRTKCLTELEPADEDVGGISEIRILPDGRVYVLGLSEAILEVLRESGPWEGLAPQRQPPRSRDKGTR